MKIHQHLLRYCPETKIRACLKQVTPSKIDEICPLAIPNLIFTISMHILSLAKIHWYSLKLSLRSEKTGMQITPSKIDKVCPLAIPNQISTISMHNGSLAKIHWYLHVLKLSSGNKTWTDEHTDDQHETLIPRHYHVAGYKRKIFQNLFWWNLYIAC